MIEKIPVDQDLKGVIERVNELIDMANELVSVGLAGIAGTNAVGCCTEEKEHD